MTIINRQKWKIACFDLDGTLVRSTSTGQHLAEKMGHSEEMAKVEALYGQGKVSNADVATLDGKYYNGYTTSDICCFLEDIPTVDHIAETIMYLKAKGIPSLVCTLAWNFVAEIIAKRYGFVGWSGPALITDSNGMFTGKVLSVFHETDKPVFVNEYCKKYNVNMSEVFHVGDSRSDLPLFKAVGFSVAFNGNDLAKSVASVCVDGESLMDILDVIPGLKFMSRAFHTHSLPVLALR